MSIYPSPDKLDKQESKFALVILAAKRARQVKDKAQRLVPTTSVNVLTIALEEIAEGMIIPRHVEDASVAAYKDALKPNVPSLEDIIGAGPVIPIEQDGTASQIAALRNAEPDGDDDDLLSGSDEEERAPVDTFDLVGGGMMEPIEEDDMNEEMETDEE